MGAQKILYLYGINILAAADNNIFLSVHQINKALFVPHRHIAGAKPLAAHHGSCRLRVLIVTSHNTRPLDRQLTHCAVSHRLAFFVKNLHFPAKTGNSNSSYVADIFHSQMHTARPDGLTQTIVRIILMVREHPLPPGNQAGRHGLSADVHQTPLRQCVFIKVDLPRVDGVQNILRPRHKQPDNRAALVGNRLNNALGADALKQHTLAA